MVITSIVTGWYMRSDMFKHDENRHKKFGNEIWEELKLTPKQTELFNIQRDSFFKTSHSLFDSLEAKRKDMISELSKPQPDTAKLYAIADQMGFYHIQLKRKTVNHLLLLRSYCTPEQVVMLSKLNDRLIRPEGPKKRGDRRPDDKREPRPEK